MLFQKALKNELRSVARPFLQFQPHEVAGVAVHAVREGSHGALEECADRTRSEQALLTPTKVKRPMLRIAS
jgi:hypothetical protein